MVCFNASSSSGRVLPTMTSVDRFTHNEMYMCIYTLFCNMIATYITKSTLLILLIARVHKYSQLGAYKQHKAGTLADSDG